MITRSWRETTTLSEIRNFQKDLKLNDFHADSTLVGAVEVRLLRLPMVEQLAANHGTVAQRELAVLGLGRDDGESRQQWSWGECVALSTRGYTTHSASECINLLNGAAPRLLGRTPGQLLEHALDGADGREPLVGAALEMAALDLVGKVHVRSAAEMLATDRADVARSVPAGATLGLGPVDELSASARGLYNAGYRRIKVKIQPGHDLDVVKALMSHAPGDAMWWQLDANGSYRPDDIATMVQLGELGVSAIEQPFHPTDEASAATLTAELHRRQLPCVVVADEAATEIGAIDRLAAEGLAGAVTVKPFRFGGLVRAAEAIDRARRLGLAVSIGGMIESGLGRRALAALACRPGVNLIGDLGPSHRWLRRDPWPDLQTSLNTERTLTVTVPTEPGVAPSPDNDLLDTVTVQRHRFC